MTRYRVHGTDVPFCAWMRSRNELPSFSGTCGFVASDSDLYIHRYLTAIDGKGKREVQGLLFLELKTRGGEPHASQLDTLWKFHATMMTGRNVRIINDEILQNFGVAFLSLSDTTPDNSESMRWGRFKGKFCAIRWTTIDVAQLLKLLRFEIHPDNLKERPFRRHHKDWKTMETVPTPLGFSVEIPVIRRS